MWKQAGGKAPFSQGILYKKRSKLESMLANKASVFEMDTACSHTPSAPESGVSKRYRAAFDEIIAKHIKGQAEQK